MVFRVSLDHWTAKDDYKVRVRRQSSFVGLTEDISDVDDWEDRNAYKSRANSRSCRRNCKFYNCRFMSRNNQHCCYHEFCFLRGGKKCFVAAKRKISYEHRKRRTKYWMDTKKFYEFHGYRRVTFQYDYSEGNNTNQNLLLISRQEFTVRKRLKEDVEGSLKSGIGGKHINDIQSSIGTRKRKKKKKKCISPEGVAIAKSRSYVNVLMAKRTGNSQSRKDVQSTSLTAKKKRKTKCSTVSNLESPTESTALVAERSVNLKSGPTRREISGTDFVSVVKKGSSVVAKTRPFTRQGIPLIQSFQSHGGDASCQSVHKCKPSFAYPIHSMPGQPELIHSMAVPTIQPGSISPIPGSVVSTKGTLMFISDLDVHSMAESSISEPTTAIKGSKMSSNPASSLLTSACSNPGTVMVHSNLESATLTSLTIEKPKSMSSASKANISNSKQRNLNPNLAISKLRNPNLIEAQAKHSQENNMPKLESTSLPSQRTRELELGILLSKSENSKKKHMDLRQYHQQGSGKKPSNPEIRSSVSQPDSMKLEPTNMTSVMPTNTSIRCALQTPPIIPVLKPINSHESQNVERNPQLELEPKVKTNPSKLKPELQPKQKSFSSKLESLSSVTTSSPSKCEIHIPSHESILKSTMSHDMPNNERSSSKCVPKVQPALKISPPRPNPKVSKSEPKKPSVIKSSKSESKFDPKVSKCEITRSNTSMRDKPNPSKSDGWKPELKLPATAMKPKPKKSSKLKPKTSNTESVVVKPVQDSRPSLCSGTNLKDTIPVSKGKSAQKRANPEKVKTVKAMPSKMKGDCVAMTMTTPSKVPVSNIKLKVLEPRVRVDSPGRLVKDSTIQLASSIPQLQLEVEDQLTSPKLVTGVHALGEIEKMLGSNDDVGTRMVSSRPELGQSAKSLRTSKSEREKTSKTLSSASKQISHEPSKEDIKLIIFSVMQASGISSKCDIPCERKFDKEKVSPYSLRFFSTKESADFYCSQCKFSYQAIAYCYLDLKTLSICHRFLKDCKHCKNWTRPIFRANAIETMAHNAVKQFFIFNARFSKI